MKAYFDIPTQVKWKNPDFDETNESDTEYFGGIAYKDEIICVCCGGTIPISEVDEIIEFDWINLSDEIIGDEA